MGALELGLLLCGASVSSCQHASYGGVEVRFEVLVHAAWKLYALLLEMNLGLTPASHRELLAFCALSPHSRSLPNGAVVRFVLEVTFSKAA